MSTQKQRPVTEGTVTNVALDDDHGKANVTLTIECGDGATFEESYDMAFNMARAQDFAHNYGVHPDAAEGTRVNVFRGNEYNPRHVLLSYPLKTIGGTTLVSENDELPVSMG